MRNLFALLLCAAYLFSQDPPKPPSESEALSLFRHGKFDEAYSAYSALMPSCVRCGPIHAGMIRSLLAQQKLKEADSAAAIALSDLPKDSFVHAAIGELRFRQSRLDDAAKELVLAANTKPTDPRAFLGLARFYRTISKFKTAADMITRAHAMAPDDPEITHDWLLTQAFSARLKGSKDFLAESANVEQETKAEVHAWVDYQEKVGKFGGSGCRLTSNFESTDASMQVLWVDPKHVRGAGLEVKINDRKSTLRLDTGASGINISRKLAQKIGIESIAEWMTSGIGDKGLVRSSVGRIKSFQVGALRFEDCLVTILDLDSFDDDGLIGADVFANYMVTLDFPAHKMHLGALPKRPEDSTVRTSLSSAGANLTENGSTDAMPEFHDRYTGPELKDFVLAVRFGNHLFIPTRINKGEGTLFLLDSGSPMNVLSIDAARQYTTVRRDSETQVKGISGEVKKVSSADQTFLTFAGLTQEARDLVTLDLSRQSQSFGIDVGGILGYTTLSMLKIDIDYRDGMVRMTFPGDIAPRGRFTP